MNYLPEDKIFLWEKLVLNADKYHEPADFNIRDFAVNGYESTVAEYVLELATTEPMAIRIVGKIGNAEDLIKAPFKMSINKKMLQKRLHDYISAFIAGDLKTNPGIRYYSAKLQMDNFVSAIKRLTPAYGLKNIVITLREIITNNGWEGRDDIISSHRFYETMLSLEQNGDIEILDLRKYGGIFTEFVFSISPVNIPRFKDIVKIVPAYSKFEENLRNKPLVWHCPLCRSHIANLDSKETVGDYLERFGRKDFAKCKDRRHLNRFWIEGDMIWFETIPVKITELIDNKKEG